MVKKIFTILQLIILFGFVSGLHDEPGRLQILSMIIHTMVMRENDKVATDVDLTELSSLTKNFSGAEIEGLVRCAQATAMNRLIKVIKSAYLTELATLTKNFSGAEIEGLVRCAQATAMNRLIKVSKSAYLTELATLTKNFSLAEIEGLVRCTQATAMNQLIKVRSDFPLCSHMLQ